MKIDIYHHTTGCVLFSHDVDANTTRLTLEAAVSASADLAGANLHGADLAGANLHGADLAGADLTGANLRGADLRRADLRGVGLYRANLAGANLHGADLAGADLAGEILTKVPIVILNLAWPILITKGFMQIGCQRHSHEAWRSFKDGTIRHMGNGATEFWAQWRSPLLAMCDSHAAAGVNKTPTE